MKRIITPLMEWKDRVVLDGIMAIGEALLVLFISFLSIFAIGIKYGLDTTGVNIFDAFHQSFVSYFKPTDVFTYLTGILSSTTAFIIFRLSVLRTYIRRVVLILVMTALSLWLATPLFMAGLVAEPRNREFAGDLAIILVLFAFFVWWFSLFSQRRMLERSVTVSGDDRGKKMAEKLERSL